MADSSGQGDASNNPKRVEEVTPSDETNNDAAKDRVESVPSDDQKKENVSESEDDNEWLDVLGSGQLRKKVVKAGQGEGTRPDRGMAITVRYIGRLQDGTEVESQEKATFTQGEGEIVQAIDLCVCLMELGEVAEIQTNSRFAYSEYGKEPNILPNTDMIYEVELLEVNPPPTPAIMTLDEICQLADKKREYGNELFGRKDYSGAINSYTRAISLLEDSPEVGIPVEETLVKCFNNLAAAQLKVEAFSAALKSCNSALTRDPNNVKALFRKGKVLACQQEFTEAQTYLKKALAIEPANKTIHQELAKLSAKYQKEVQSEKEMYQRMVGDMAAVTEKTEKKSSRAKYILIGLSVLIAVIAVALTLHLS